MCPSCKSDDVRKLSVIYESGTTVGSLSASGLGMTRDALGGGVMTGELKTGTLLAQRAAPPKPVTSFGMAALFCFLGLVFLALSIVGLVKGGTVESISITFLISVVLLALGVAAFRMNEKEQTVFAKRKSEWAKTWLCMKCGEKFVEGEPKLEFSAQIRKIRDQDGKIEAIKIYRTAHPEAGLAEAKQYVESL